MKSIDRIDSQNRCPRMRMSKLEGRVTVRGTNFKWDARDKFNLRREWPVPGTRCQEFWAKADAIVASERLLDRHVNMLRTKEYGSRASWSAWILETEGLSLWCRFPCSLIRDSPTCVNISIPPEILLVALRYSSMLCPLLRCFLSRWVISPVCVYLRCKSVYNSFLNINSSLSAPLGSYLLPYIRRFF